MLDTAHGSNAICSPLCPGQRAVDAIVGDDNHDRIGPFWDRLAAGLHRAQQPAHHRRARDKADRPDGYSALPG
jgi:hypothetical protein